MNSLISTFKNIRENLTSSLKESCYREKGQITINEFLEAGDHLVSSSPSWTWQKGDDSLKKNYLPTDKQFLLIKQVRCPHRVSYIRGNNFKHTEVDSDISGETWTLTEINKNPDDDIDIIDFDEFNKNVKIEDENNNDTTNTSIAKTIPNTNEIKKEENEIKKNEDNDDDDDDDEELALDSSAAETSSTADLRFYDLSIIYDGYYYVPKMFLTAYDSEGNRIDPNLMLQDVIVEYSNQTVTIENHPHLKDVRCLSVHPCKHSDAMLKIINNLGDNFQVNQYIFYFLKFFQSVVPTIEYDITSEVRVIN